MIFAQITAVNRSSHSVDGLYNTAAPVNRQALIVLVVCASGFLRAESEISAPEGSNERQETTSDQEWEAKGIIPEGGLTVSTQPITPIMNLPEKKPQDQAVEELSIALDLWKKGKAEASSDVALEAYDDFMSLHLSRRNKKRRQELRLQRRQAATVYVDSSIAYIQDYVKKNGSTPKALEEGRARLGDLHDVAQNYPELTNKLNDALESYQVNPSSSAPKS
jgi:hypothetical protein